MMISLALATSGYWQLILAALPRYRYPHSLPSSGGLGALTTHCANGTFYYQHFLKSALFCHFLFLPQNLQL